MPMTITELARLAGVSPGAVSLALNGKAKGQVSAERRDRILSLAKRHGYRSNQAAKALVERRTYHVALCHDRDLSSSRYVDEMYGVMNLMNRFSDALSAAGYAIEILNLHGLGSRERACEALSRMAVDGFVLMMMSPRRVEPLMRFLKGEGRPALASGATLSDAYTWTDIDRADAIARAVRRLSRQGHTRIAFLEMGPRGLLTIKRRAYLAAMRAELNVDARPWVFRAEKRQFVDVMRETEVVLDTVKGVTAILLSSTYYCDAVTHALSCRGARPGEDCRVLAFGETAFARRASPLVTHYSLRVAQEVAFGVAALMAAMNDAEALQGGGRLFRSRLVKGGT